MIRARQKQILDHVLQAGIISYNELAKMTGVSTFTIRRDIAYLDKAKLLVQVKGGAQRLDGAGAYREARLPSRMQINLPAKERIAAKTLEFIHPGETIFLDGSSTILCLARAIAANLRDITVVTNSILVALELAEAATIRLIGLGGIFDRETYSFVGFEAEDPANESEAIHVDKAFFSCAGFVPEQGTYENAAFNRQTKRQIAARAGKVFLLIDSSKFGQKALARVLDTAQIQTIITERDVEGIRGVEMVVA